jgi:glutamate synthase (NADPH/NADH) large chain
VAEEVREILASLGFRRLTEVIGRTDLLKQVSRGSEDLDDLDLNPLLVKADAGPNPPYCTLEGRNEVPETLDADMIRDAAALFEHGEKMQLQYNIRNTHRAIGTKISSRIVRKFGMEGLQPGTSGAAARLGRAVARRLRRAGPQAGGVRRRQRLRRQGPVGRHHRGAAGALLDPGVERERHRRQHRALRRDAGELYAGGQAGERFAVRNSGATAVVEGCGANGCEYMTGGTVAILGPVGDNFGAGFTGGVAFLYDPEGTFERRVNPDTLLWSRVGRGHWDDELRAWSAGTWRKRARASPPASSTTGKGQRGHFWHVVPRSTRATCRCRWRASRRPRE